ncbi:MAG: DUF2062 domain-containing protein [Moraxellaceae bacterium]|nr:DUF2062 domain-containing protein [Moraxellaceae bacterium]
MRKWWRRAMPDHARVRDNRWLNWLGPGLFDPRLWHFRRRSVAAGVAIGVFFGLLVPVAQIPASAGAALLLRANLPAAIGSTLVTNPLTVAPIYMLAHRVGSRLLDEENGGEARALVVASEAGDYSPTAINAGWWERTLASLNRVGRPLLLGLAIFAVGTGLIVYVLIMLLWRLQVVRAWQRRRERRARRH